MANDMTLEAVIKLQDEMSKELKKIQKNLDTFEDATEDTNRALQDLQKESKQTGKVLQSINFKEGVQTALDFGRAILDAASALGDFVKEYQEFNTLEAKLAGSSKQYGYNQEQMSALSGKVYSYTGDEMMAFNSVQNLQGMGLSTKELEKTLESAMAVWTAYGDSIPIEGLTESINETAQVAKVTGSLADALNWAGISEDKFNTQLEACGTVQERNKLITDALNGAYGDSLKTFTELNAATIDARNADWALLSAKAALAEAISPLTTEFTRFTVQILQNVLPAIQNLVENIIPAMTESSEFKDVFETLWNSAKAVIDAVRPTIQDIFTWLAEHSDELISIIKSLGNIWGAVWQEAGPLIQAAWKIIETSLNGVIKVIQTLVGWLDKAISLFRELGNASDNNYTKGLAEQSGNGHAAGLNYVPYNNYPALLHQGETVLARRDADKWRSGDKNTPQVSIIMNGTVIREDADVNKVASQIVRKINQQRIITGG